MKEAYKMNDIFRNYVDRYSTKHNISSEEALTHLMVKNYYEYLKNEGKLR